MSAREFREWQAYHALEPWGATRDNWHAGLIAAAVANYGMRELKRPAKAADWMLKDPVQADSEQQGRRTQLLTTMRMAATPGRRGDARRAARDRGQRLQRKLQ